MGAILWMIAKYLLLGLGFLLGLCVFALAVFVLAALLLPKDRETEEEDDEYLIRQGESILREMEEKW